MGVVTLLIIMIVAGLYFYNKSSIGTFDEYNADIKIIESFVNSGVVTKEVQVFFWLIVMWLLFG